MTGLQFPRRGEFAIRRIWTRLRIGFGAPGICLFCGWGMRNSKDFVHIGEFVADPQCYYDFKEVIGVRYLESAGYRPPVIIVPIHFPGSIDNAILDLAWGPAAHNLFAGSHFMSPASLERKTETEAAKLVRKMEVQLTSSGEKRGESSPSDGDERGKHRVQRGLPARRVYTSEVT